MRYLLWSVVLAGLLTAATVIFRPPLPVDETRYLSVAWEAQFRGDYLVSHLNHEPYSHKPPLLFWLINLMWAFTGVNGAAARIVAPAAGIVCLPLTRLMAQRLWPEERVIADSAPMVLVAAMLWLVFAPVTMFDTLLTLCVLASLLGVLRAERGCDISGWLWAGVFLGAGVLAKGPVVLVHTLPAAVLAPWWSVRISSRWRWYAGCLAAVLIAAVISLSWAIPSALAGGEAYRQELLFGQTAGRMVNSFAHRQPVWWYLPLLPLCLLPWMLLIPLWRGLTTVRFDSGLKFLLTWAGCSVLILSLVSGKQIYYLLPIVPAASLIIARATGSAAPTPRQLDLAGIAVGTMFLALLPLLANHLPLLRDSPLAGIIDDWVTIPLAGCGVLLLLPQRGGGAAMIARVSTAAVCFMAFLIWALSVHFWKGFDLTPLADFVSHGGRPVAWFGNYHGQLNFLGSIRHVPEVLTEEQLSDWLTTHPDGAVVLRLSTDRETTPEELRTLQTLDRTALHADQSIFLNEIIRRRTDIPLADRNPSLLFVQWIRRGLPLDPLIVLTYPKPDLHDP